MKNVVSDFSKYLSKQALLNVYGSSPSGETLRLGNSAARESGQVTLINATGVGGWKIENAEIKARLEKIEKALISK